MAEFTDLTNKVFTRYTVICLSHRDYGKIFWRCQCSCGKIKLVNGQYLKSGTVKSCGCYRSDNTKAQKTTHGNTHHPLYKKWVDMRSRCYYKKNKKYSCYGGRGIIVCKKWRNSFVSFYNWAIMSGWKAGLTIERRRVNGNYTPKNCTWATMMEQNMNKRNTVYITYKGERKSLVEWCKIKKIDKVAVYSRIFLSKWTVELALNQPVKKRIK